MYYDEPWSDEPDRRSEHWKHSGFGIASFVVALLTGLAMFLMLALAGYLEVTTPGGVDEESSEAMLVGLLILFCLLAALVGAALGIAGLVQARRQKMFAVLGLIFNVLIVLGVLGIMVIGLMVE